MKRGAGSKWHERTRIPNRRAIFGISSGKYIDLKGIINVYNALIEKGKRKLGYYNPDMTDRDRFLMSFLIYFTVLIMVVFVADLLAQMVYEDSNSLYPLQVTEAKLIERTQSDIFGIPVNRVNATLYYDVDAEWHGQSLSKDDKIGGFNLEIDSVCTGFHETVFLGVLILGFRGVPLRLRAKWAVIFSLVIFVENLFRIFALYPMALYWGRDFEEWFHYYWWHYGQYAFIMTLFGLWFVFVARKYVNPDAINVNPEAIKKKKEGKDEGNWIEAIEGVEGRKDMEKEPFSKVIEKEKDIWKKEIERARKKWGIKDEKGVREN